MEPSGNMATGSTSFTSRWLGPGGLRDRPVAVAAVTITAVLLAATVALWVHYGTAVFYEMIVAGIAACI